MKEDREPNRGMAAWILLYFFIASVMLVLLLSGCCPKIIERVETKVEYRDRVVHDTTTFEVPVEVEKIVTRDTASHLENSFAKSDALVSGGFLSHSLESIPQYIKVPVEVHVTDTLWRQSEVVERVKEVKVEQPISWWKRFEIGAFPWLVFSVILLLLWTFRKFIKKLL